VKGAVSHHNGLFFLHVIVCVHIIMPMITQQQQQQLHHIAVDVGVPVAKQQGCWKLFQSQERQYQQFDC
jgi:hypothetical protein